MPIDPRYDRAPTFRGGGGGGNRIADLIYQSGRDQAENTLRSGETFANSLAGLGQIFAPAFAARRAKKDEAKVQAAIQQGVAPGDPGMDMDAEGNPTEARPRSSNMFDAIKGLPPELRSRAMQGIEKWREEDSKRQEHDLRIQELQQKIDETKTAKQQRAADQLAGGAKSTLDMFDTPQGAVVAVNGFHSAAKGSGLVDDRLDAFVSGVNDAWQAAQGDPKREAMFLDALKTQGSPILQTLMQRGSPEWQEKNKPKTRTVTITNPDGSKVEKIVEDKPGAEFASAATPPKPGTEEDFIVGRYGRNPTPEQSLKGRAEYAAAGREHKATEGDESRKRLVAAVVANPALWDDLTPSDKGNIAGDLNKQGFAGFGKGLPEKAVGKISESKSAVDSLRDLRDVLKANEQYIGPIAGLQAMNPYSDARKAQANIDLVRQRVGKALEGGVLRKEDEEKYKKILATLRDEPETAIYKVDNIIKNIENDLGNYIEEQRLSGRRVNTGVENRAGSGKAPAKGARRMVQGKLAEWDGQGWMAVR